MHRLFVILTLYALLTSCSKQDDSVSPDALTGTWVERSARKDTLVFNLDRMGSSLPNTLLVNRGRELNAAGYLLPRLGNGIYSYELRNDRIYVRNLLSSASQGSDYSIKRNGNELVIDNFFELGFNQPATATRTLIRLP